jgi:hypothetical protein
VSSVAEESHFFGQPLDRFLTQAKEFSELTEIQVSLSAIGTGMAQPRVIFSWLIFAKPT